MMNGPAAEAVKKVVSASNRATPCAAAMSRFTAKEKNMKNGIRKANMIIPGRRYCVRRSLSITVQA
jgi:hypothetical protein